MICFFFFFFFKTIIRLALLVSSYSFLRISFEKKIHEKCNSNFNGVIIWFSLLIRIQIKRVGFIIYITHTSVVRYLCHVTSLCNDDKFVFLINYTRRTRVNDYYIPYSYCRYSLRYFVAFNSN